MKLKFIYLIFCLPIIGCAPGLPVTSNTKLDMGTPPFVPGTDIQFTVRLTAEAGKEIHLCQYTQMPQHPSGIFVSGRAHEWSGTVHHYAYFRTKLDKLPDGKTFDEVWDCDEDTSTDALHVGVVVEQIAKNQVDFPAGIALPFSSQEIGVIQVHAVNTTQTPVEANLQVTFNTIPADQVTQHMGFLAFYDPFIYVPPVSRATAHMRCAIPADIHLFELTPHYHLRGQKFDVLVHTSNTTSTTPLFESTDWEHPKVWRGDMPVAAGSSVQFSCEYKNDDARVYTQGAYKQTNEMCFLWGYYYPAFTDPNADFCNVAGNDAQYGVGAKTCGETLRCVQQCADADAPVIKQDGRIDVGECWQKCVSDSCPSASKPLFDLITCVKDHCGMECKNSKDPGCTSCATSNCLMPGLACQTAKCQ